MHRYLVFFCVAATVIVGLLAACSETDYYDGALCSTAGTCPPGQSCSADGMCLRPCPIPDCAGESCGCGTWEATHREPDQYICHNDGLCHFGCNDSGWNCTDSENFVCDVSQGLCKHRCGTDSYCPPDTTCVPDGEQGVCHE